MAASTKRPFFPPDGDSSSKRAKAEEDEGGQDPPLRFLSWNANGMGPRMGLSGKAKGAHTNDLREIREAIREHKPDFIAIQEVRLMAQALNNAKKGDGQRRKRGELNDTKKQMADEKQAFNAFMRSDVLNGYTVTLSLADDRAAGSAVLIRKGVKEPKLSFSAENLQDNSVHDFQGRVIIAEYDDLVVLSTYVPNNGYTPSSFERRAKWDEEIGAFLIVKRLEGKSIVWLGDLNVAHTDADVSHPDFFRAQGKETPASVDDAGMHGFTKSEQRRFGDILRAADLADAYREMHPAEKPVPFSERAYSWRGTSEPSDKYYKKGMRLDYTCLSRALLPRLETADILGGAQREEGFLGSDHCPILMTLRPAT